MKTIYTVRAVRMGRVVRFERMSEQAAKDTARRLSALGWTVIS